MTYPSTSLLRRASATFAVGAALAFGSVASAATILIDFGSSSTSPTNFVTNDAGWNNITNSSTDTANVALIDSTGAASGVTLTITSPFNTNPPNLNGTTSPTGDAAAYPVTATRDNFFSNTETFNGQGNLTPQITFGGLNPNMVYSFTYFASRVSVSDNRSADYTLSNGMTSSVVSLNASNNTGTVVTSAFLAPSVSGTLVLDIDPSAANNNANHFTYLGVIEITAVAIPEPGAYAGLAGLAALGFVAARRRARA